MAMPIRTSIITGKKCDANEFWRLTIQNGFLVFDEKIKNSGRGTYIEKDLGFIKKLPKLKGKIEYLLKKKDFIIDIDTLNVPVTEK